ncbi:ribonuclease HIII [Oceanobacillus kimchii]|uniref:ribonuclease HIII n=1 Tax=Oceanobacillus kimchii TaxID=746691 RepID=UPI00034BEDC9|nr:ribonuclease HIII [Oceanobacillus kimchii]
MSQQVIVTTKEQIQEMKKYYISQLTSTPQGAIFRAKTNNAVITAYQSGKVLFQGSAPESEAMKWADITVKDKKKQALDQKHSYSPHAGLFTDNHIGSDEAGTGDYFGPITVAALFATKEQQVKLKQIGVRDSKHLNDTKIKQIAKEIVQLQIPYTLLLLPNEKYNKLQAKGWSQGKMKAMLHHHAIDKLLQKFDVNSLKGIVIDQFCQPPVYKKYLQSEKKTLHPNTTFITKAESHSVSVAAASILARSRFVKAMDELSEDAKIELPKGASAKVDQTAARIMRSKGFEALDKYAKTHFANTQKAQKLL